MDDEKVMRIALGMLINWSELGYNLLGAAADGLQALELIESSNPDIVITDLNMPNMDGLDLIRKLRESNFSGKIIVLSNYDDFEMVREAMKLGAVDYILKVTLKAKDLIEILDKASSVLLEERHLKIQNNFMLNELIEKQLQQKNSFWKELFQEDEWYITNVIKEGKKLGISSESVAGQLFLIKIDHYDAALTNGKINNKKLLDFSVTNIIKETVAVKNAIEIVGIGNGHYVILKYSQDKSDDEAAKQQSLRHLMYTLNLYLNLSVSIAISDRFTGFDQLRVQFARCIEAMSATFYTGAGSVIPVQSVQFQSALMQSEYLEWTNELIGAVDAGDSTQITEMLDTLMEHARASNCKPNTLKHFIMTLLAEAESLIMRWEKNNGVESIIRSGRTHSELESKQQPIQQADTLETLHALAVQAFIEVVEHVLEVKQKRFRKEVLRVMEIMGEHLDRRITLEMLASAVNMTETYLCRIFKQDVGKSIVQYMNELKINHAVELLKMPDARIKEVALAVGVEDPFYFNRLFKKSVGQSPSDFRRGLFPSNQSH
ncbi:response regulator [Paenibacillus sp. OV219]|uniref:response regulator transcription factor n=1 Tax=Paenibacillus sp. OV219 TaxID=1884377 RepID=UPI002109E90C|nr:response regulator [Paenibacillus sp. OV219]